MLSLFPLAESLALAADIISEKGTDYEIVFWGKTSKRLIHYYADSVKALLSPKEDIYVAVTHPLYDIFNILTLKSIDGKVFITGITGEENHLSHTFFIFINMIHQHLHIESLLNGFKLFY